MTAPRHTLVRLAQLLLAEPDEHPHVPGLDRPPLRLAELNPPFGPPLGKRPVEYVWKAS
jgi:hypothetical protein